MSKGITKKNMALLKEASEMFNETGCVPGIDGWTAAGSVDTRLS